MQGNRGWKQQRMTLVVTVTMSDMVRKELISLKFRSLSIHFQFCLQSFFKLYLIISRLASSHFDVD